MTLNETTALMLTLGIVMAYIYYYHRPKKDFSGLDRDEAQRWLMRIMSFGGVVTTLVCVIIINLPRLYD